jgi:hypothetical protein
VVKTMRAAVGLGGDQLGKGGKSGDNLLARVGDDQVKGAQKHCSLPSKS